MSFEREYPSLNFKVKHNIIKISSGFTQYNKITVSANKFNLSSCPEKLIFPEINFNKGQGYLTNIKLKCSVQLSLRVTSNGVAIVNNGIMNPFVPDFFGISNHPTMRIFSSSELILNRSKFITNIEDNIDFNQCYQHIDKEKMTDLDFSYTFNKSFPLWSPYSPPTPLAPTGDYIGLDRSYWTMYRNNVYNNTITYSLQEKGRPTKCKNFQVSNSGLQWLMSQPSTNQNLVIDDPFYIKFDLYSDIYNELLTYNIDPFIEHNVDNLSICLNLSSIPFHRLFRCPTDTLYQQNAPAGFIKLQADTTTYQSPFLFTQIPEIHYTSVTLPEIIRSTQSSYWYFVRNNNPFSIRQILPIINVTQDTSVLFQINNETYNSLPQYLRFMVVEEVPGKRLFNYSDMGCMRLSSISINIDGYESLSTYTEEDIHEEFVTKKRCKVSYQQTISHLSSYRRPPYYTYLFNIPGSCPCYQVDISQLNLPQNYTSGVLGRFVLNAKLTFKFPISNVSPSGIIDANQFPIQQTPPNVCLLTQIGYNNVVEITRGKFPSYSQITYPKI